MTKVAKDEWYARYYTAIAEGAARGAVQPRNAGLDYALASTWADTMKRKQKQEKKAQEEDNREWWTPKNIGLDVLTTGARWLGQAGSTLRSGTVEIGQGLQAGANLIASDYVNAPSAAKNKYGTSGQASWSDFLEQSGRKGGFSGKEHMETLGVKDNWVANAYSELFLDPVNYLWGAKPLSAGARVAAVAVEKEANVIRIARVLAQKGGWLESTADDVIKASPYFDDALKVTKEAAIQILKKGPASLSRSQTKLLFATTGGAKFMGTYTVIPMEITRFITRPTALGLRQLRKMPGLSKVLDHMGGKWGTSLKRIIRNGTDEEAYGAFKTLTEFAASSSRHGSRVSKQSLVFMKITKKMTIGQLARVRNAVQGGLAEGELTKIESVLYKWLKVTFADYEALAREAGVQMGHQDNYIPWHPSDSLLDWSDELTDWVARNPDTPMWGRGSRTVKFGGVAGRAPKASFQFSRIKAGDIFLGRVVPKANNPAELEEAINAIAREVLGDDAVDLFNVNLQEVFPRAIRSMSKVIQEAEMARSLAATGVAVKVPFKPSAATKTAEKIGASLVRMRATASKKQKVVDEISELYAAQTARVEEALRAAADAKDSVPLWASKDDWDAAFAAFDDAAGNSARNAVGLSDAPLSETALRVKATADVQAHGITASLGLDTTPEVQEIFIQQRMNEIRKNEQVLADAAEQRTFVAVSDDMGEQEIHIEVAAIDERSAAAAVDYKSAEFKEFQRDERLARQKADGIVDWTKETTRGFREAVAKETKQKWAAKHGVSSEAVETEQVFTDLPHRIDSKGKTVPYVSAKARTEGLDGGNRAVHAANEALRANETSKALNSNRANATSKALQDADLTVETNVDSLLDKTDLKLTDAQERRINAMSISKEEGDVLRKAAMDHAIEKNPITDRELRAEIAQRAAQTAERDAQVKQLIDDSIENLTKKETDTLSKLLRNNPTATIDDLVDMALIELKSTRPDIDIADHTDELLLAYRSSHGHEKTGEAHIVQMEALRLQDARVAEIEMRYPILPIEERFEGLVDDSVVEWQTWKGQNPRATEDESQAKFVKIYADKVDEEVVRVNALVDTQTKNLERRARALEDYPTTVTDLEARAVRRVQAAHEKYVGMSTPMAITAKQGTPLPNYINAAYRKESLEAFLKQVEEVKRLATKRALTQEEALNRKALSVVIDGSQTDSHAWTAAMAERNELDTIVAGQALTHEESFNAVSDWERIVMRDMLVDANAQAGDWYGVFLESIAKTQAEKAKGKLALDALETVKPIARKSTRDHSIYKHSPIPDTRDPIITERVILDPKGKKRRLTQELNRAATSLIPRMKRGAPDAYLYETAAREAPQNYTDNTVKMVMDGMGVPPEEQQKIFSLILHGEMNKTLDDFTTRSGGTVVQDADGLLVINYADPSYVGQEMVGSPPARKVQKFNIEEQSAAQGGIRSQVSDKAREVADKNAKSTVNKRIRTRAAAAVHTDTANAATDVIVAKRNQVLKRAHLQDQRRKQFVKDLAEAKGKGNVKPGLGDQPDAVFLPKQPPRVTQKDIDELPGSLVSVTDREAIFQEQLATAKKTTPNRELVRKKIRDGNLLDDGERWEIEREAVEAAQLKHPLTDTTTLLEYQVPLVSQRDDFKHYFETVQSGGMNRVNVRNVLNATVTDKQREALAKFIDGLPIDERKMFAEVFADLQNGIYTSSNSENVSIEAIPPNVTDSGTKVTERQARVSLSESSDPNVTEHGLKVPVHNQVAVTRLDPTLEFEGQMAEVVSLQKRVKKLAGEDLEIVVVTPEGEVHKALKAKQNEWVDAQIAMASRKKEPYNPTQLHEQAETTITLSNKEVAEAESRAVFSFDVPQQNVAHPTATPLEEIISKNNIPEGAVEQAQKANNLYKDLAKTKDAITRLEEANITDTALTQAKKEYQRNVRRVRGQKKTDWYKTYVQKVGQEKVDAMERAIDDFFDAARLSKKTPTMEGKTVQGRTVFIQRPQRAGVDDSLWNTANEVEAQSEAALDILSRDVQSKGVLNQRLQRKTMEGEMTIPDAFDEAMDAAPTAFAAEQVQTVKAAVESMPVLTEEEAAFVAEWQQHILRNIEDATPPPEPLFQNIPPPPRARPQSAPHNSGSPRPPDRGTFRVGGDNVAEFGPQSAQEPFTDTSESVAKWAALVDEKVDDYDQAVFTYYGTNDPKWLGSWSHDDAKKALMKAFMGHAETMNKTTTVLERGLFIGTPDQADELFEKAIGSLMEPINPVIKKTPSSAAIPDPTVVAPAAAVRPAWVVDTHGVINPAVRAQIIANPTVVSHEAVVTAVAQDQVSAHADAVFGAAFGPDWRNKIPDAAGFVGPKVPTKSATKIPGSVGGDFGTFDLVDSTFLKAATDPEYAAAAYIEAVKAGDEQMARALRSVLEQGEPSENAIKLLEAAANKTRKQLDALNVKEVDMYEKLLAMDPDEFEEIARDAIGRGMKVLSSDPTYMTDETIVDAINAMSKIHEPGAFGKFLNEVFDPMVTYIKTWNTIYPGFHYKNVFGNAFNNWIAGVSTSSYRLHNKISKATRQRVKNAGEWGDAFKALSLDEQNIANQLYDHELGVGVYSNEFLYGADVPDATSTEGLANKLRSGRDAYRKVAKYNPLGAHGPVARGSRFLGHRGDDWGRGVMFVDTLKNGGSVDEALARIHKFHFDYADLSPFERRIKRVVPFYTWTRNNLPLQLQMMPLNPGKYNLWFSLKRAIENGEEGDPPDYFSEGMNPSIRLPWEHGGGSLYFTDQTPVNDTAMFGDPVGRLAGMVTPVIRVPWERITNKKMFKGMAFSDREPIVAPQIWSAIPGFMPLLSLAGRADKVDGQWVMSDRDAYTIDNFMPFLGRLRRLHPSEQKYQEKIVSSFLSFVIGGWIRTDTSGEQQSRLDAEGMGEAYDVINGGPTTRKIVDGKVITTRRNGKTTSEAYKRIQRIRASKGAQVGGGSPDRHGAYVDALANLKRERDKVLTP